MPSAGFEKYLKVFIASALLAALSGGAVAQDRREIDVLSEIGKEIIAQREAAAAAAIEAEHQKRLEEQSRLKQAARGYLGEARKAALVLITQKRKQASGERVTQLRQQARLIIDEVDDATKGRVKSELDPIFAELEKLIGLSQQELLSERKDLVAMRRRLSDGDGSIFDWVDRVAIMYAMCEEVKHAEVIAANVKYREQLTDDEADAIDDCNWRRLVLGLNPLAADMKLVECSRDHSNDMVTQGFFAHESPVPGKKTPWDRAKNFGTKASGENIAAGYNNGFAAVDGWWYSPGHLKNMMNRGHKRVGVGQKNETYTQMFGG